MALLNHCQNTLKEFPGYPLKAYSWPFCFLILIITVKLPLKSSAANESIVSDQCTGQIFEIFDGKQRDNEIKSRMWQCDTEPWLIDWLINGS